MGSHLNENTRMTLIAIPLKFEMQFLIEQLELRGHPTETVSLSHMSVRKIPSLNTFVGVAGHGKTQFALQTQYLLLQLRGIKQVLGLGGAGALTEKTAIGDLVLSLNTIEHDYTERFLKQQLPSFRGHSSLLDIGSSVKVNGYKIHRGIVASGDEDIVDTSRAQEIFARTEALAVAWEGAGLARACQFMKVPHLEIRAITDFANKSTPIDFQSNLKLAMQNSAQFLISFIAELNRRSEQLAF